MKKKKVVRRRGPGTLLYYYSLYVLCNLFFLLIYGPHFGYAVIVQNKLNYDIAVTPIDGVEAFENVTPVILHSMLFLHNGRSVNIIVPARGEYELYFSVVEHGPERIIFKRLAEGSELHAKIVPSVTRLSRGQTVAIGKDDIKIGAVPMIEVIDRRGNGYGGVGLITVLELMGLYIPVCLPVILIFGLGFAIKMKFDKP